MSLPNWSWCQVGDARHSLRERLGKAMNAQLEEPLIREIWRTFEDLRIEALNPRWGWQEWYTWTRVPWGVFIGVNEKTKY